MPALGSPPPGRFYLDSSALVLKGLKAEDSGAYTCVAHNTAGEDARLHTVSVLGEQLRGEERWGSAICGSPATVGPPPGHLHGDARARMQEPGFKPQPGHPLTSLGLCILFLARDPSTPAPGCDRRVGE